MKSQLQYTVLAESLDADHKKQLNEKQEIINGLLNEIERRKLEFDEYCKQVDVDNDRQKVELQFKYEKKLQEEEENCMKWRGEAGVLKKKFSTLSREAENYRKDIETLQYQQGKFQQAIKQHQKDIEDLKCELSEREAVIKDKERKLHEVGRRNGELEKYKQVQIHKINELRVQFEPKTREIKEKKEVIAEMEKKLEEFQQNNKQLVLQLQELRDKYYGADLELRKERNRFRGAKYQYQQVCREIYNVAGLIQKPDDLKRGIKDLSHRYSVDKEACKSLSSNDEVQNEFLRQREHLEKVTKSAIMRSTNKKDTSETMKLMKENMELLAELNKLRELLNEKQRACTRMEALLGLSSKAISPREAKLKLEKAVAVTIEHVSIGV